LKNPPPPNSQALWALTALEGAAVIVLETLCAKYLAPAYGDSLQVWASVMGVTLAGLTIGYFFGGHWAQKRPDIVWGVSLAAAASMMMVPSVATWLIPILTTGHLFTDSLTVAGILLLPILALMGMLPALIVQNLAQNSTSGKLAGRVFTVSTSGAIVAVYVTGFILIPVWGATLPLLFAAMALSLPALWVLIRQKRMFALTVALPLMFALGHHGSSRFPDGASLKVVEYNEGILGQVLVGDFDYQTPEGQTRKGRALYVNRMPQTMVDVVTGQALFSPYLDFMDVATHPVGNGDMLMLGLGGGNLVSRFLNQGRRVDVCELDERVVKASQQYFSLSNAGGAARFFVDDARHFIRKSPKKYDLIAYDIFKGESPPHHAFTVEAFEDAADILKPQGMIVINFLGRTQGERSKGPLSVIKTLQAGGFKTITLAIPKIDNVIVLAARDRIPPLDDRLLPYQVANLNLDAAEMLTDDRPMLELLHAETADWNRNWYYKTYTTRFLKEKVPLFR